MIYLHFILSTTWQTSLSLFPFLGVIRHSSSPLWEVFSNMRFFSIWRLLFVELRWNFSKDQFFGTDFDHISIVPLKWHGCLIWLKLKFFRFEIVKNLFIRFGILWTVPLWSNLGSTFWQENSNLVWSKSLKIFWLLKIIYLCLNVS